QFKGSQSTHSLSRLLVSGESKVYALETRRRSSTLYSNDPSLPFSTPTRLNFCQWWLWTDVKTYVTSRMNTKKNNLCWPARYH
ncbi:hypothetical protein PENTCL1PPCAC_8800, partial [Pristionchus entomophagus]